MTFEQIYKQAQAQGKTGNMTLKEFKKKMKEQGYTANSKNARAYFYKEENKNIPVEKRSLEVEIQTPTQFNGKIGNSGVREGMVIGGPNMNFDQALNLATSLGLKTFTYANDGKLKMTWNHPNARKAIKKYEAPDIDENKFRAPQVPQFPLSYYDQMVLKGKVEPNNFQFETLYKKQGGKMTQKFQQGGQASSQDAVMQFVQALAQTLQADPNQVIQAAQQNPDALKSAVQVYQQTQDMNQAAQAFAQALQAQTQAAKHGAKLNYLKTLKNQCAEDEELVYFKKGGKVDCGCVKKSQEGGKTPKKESPVMKFKKTIKHNDQAAKDSIEINKYNDEELQATRPGKVKTIINGKDTTTVWVPDRTKAPYKKTEKKEKGGEVKKDCGGSKMKLKKGDKVCPKCGKVHAGACGSKLKKHQNGGSLNGVLFIQQGKDLPTAESAKVRYKGANGRQYGTGNVKIQEIWNPNTNAKIKLAVVGNDSTITETPPHSWYITPQARIATNYMSFYHQYPNKEWDTLKKRLEEAKQVMSKVPYYSPKDGTYPLPK